LRLPRAPRNTASMTDEPQDSFRNRVQASKGPKGPELVVNNAPPEKYAAFNTKDKVVRLDIRCGGESTLAHAIAYSYMLNLAYDRRTYSEFFITVSGITIRVKGRGLKPVVEAIKMHKCEFIQAFDAGEFDEPEGEGAPFIESITVEMLRG
jgi:hypothetical protein